MVKSITAVLIASATLAVMSPAHADSDTVVGGKAFFDFTNLNQQSDGNKTDASGTGVDVKRFYLSVTHDFDKVWSANVTSDFNYVSNDGQTQIYIKKVYVQAKISDAFAARLGSADLPWVPFVEGLYGYRFVENVLVDRLKFGTSADWGVHAYGKLLDGSVSYAASVVNGAGYKNPTRSKSMDFEGRVSYQPIKEVTVAVGFYSGKLGKETQTIGAKHTANRFTALVAYVNPTVRLGAEYFTAKDWGQVLSVDTDKADGFSVWGAYNINSQVSVFARGDRSKPKKDLNPDLKDTYFNIGVAYRPVKNVDLAVVYKHDKVENGSLGTSNGTIGGAIDGKYDEVGFWAQVSF